MMLNKMEEVAKLFDKEFNEEFTVKYQINKYKWCTVDHVVFTDKGKYKEAILSPLLTGRTVIVDE